MHQFIIEYCRVEVENEVRAGRWPVQTLCLKARNADDARRKGDG